MILFSRLQVYSPYYLVNAYGVFGFVNSNRYQLVLEYSSDGSRYRPINFQCLPGSLDRVPCVIAPLLHSRFEWSLWISTTASLEHDPNRNSRFVPGFVHAAIRRVLNGELRFAKLFDADQVIKTTPKNIRAALFLYNFTSVFELLETGKWYSRQQVSDWVTFQK